MTLYFIMTFYYDDHFRTLYFIMATSYYDDHFKTLYFIMTTLYFYYHTIFYYDNILL